MHLKKNLWIIGVVSLLAVFGLSTSAWSGYESPPATGEIVGPELWGVVVIDCSAENVVALRVKRVVDCEVQTQAVVQSWTGCPADETDPLYETFDVTLFDINPNPAVKKPIITKVKNFKSESGGAVYSFDVQIKFWVP